MPDPRVHDIVQVPHDIWTVGLFRVIEFPPYTIADLSKSLAEQPADRLNAYEIDIRLPIGRAMVYVALPISGRNLLLVKQT